MIISLRYKGMTTRLKHINDLKPELRQKAYHWAFDNILNPDVPKEIRDLLVKYVTHHSLK